MMLPDDEMKDLLLKLVVFFRWHPVPGLPAEDLMQETWLRVIRAGHVEGEREGRRAFVLGVAKNVWKELIRQESRRPGQPPDAMDGLPDTSCHRRGRSCPEAEWEAARNDLRERAIRALGEDAELFLLTRWEGLTSRQAGARLALSERETESGRRRILRFLSDPILAQSLVDRDWTT